MNRGFNLTPKVLLINPPLTHYSGSIEFDVHLPIGLMYVAAMVRDFCHVEIFDSLVYDSHTTDEKSVTFGATPEQIQEIIQEKQPDIVGISVHSTAQYKNAELVAKIAKQIDPKIITVFGGPDPSVRYTTILQNQYCDYCVVGDGEETFLEFIKNFTCDSSIKGINGLAYKKNGEILYTLRVFDTNLDKLPFPAFDLIDLKRYLENKKYYKIRSRINKKSTTIITSRGCPNRCVFCSVRLHMGQKYRFHSPEYVLKLIHLCIEKYGISNFHFEDDNLTCNEQRFERILDLIIEQNLQIKWDTPNGIRVDALNCNILRKMKKSGCLQFTLAIESGNQRVLNQVIHKGLNLEKVMEIARCCRDLKMKANAFYVIGFPGETIVEIKDTIKFAIKLFKKYDISPILMVATPLYGTDLYDICVKEKYIQGNPTPEELSVGVQSNGEPMISTPEFSKEDIRRLISEYRQKTRPIYIKHLLKHPREILDKLAVRFRF